MRWIAILTAATIAFLFIASQTQAADFQFRLGLEHGVLFPIDSSLYDGKNSLQVPGLKEGLYWPNGWSVEFSQRLISPQNHFLSYGVSSTVSGFELRAGDRYHLRYNLPLAVSARYDFQKDREAFIHPYVVAGLGVYYTVRVFERTAPPTVTEKVDRQAPIGPMLAAGLEVFQTRVKMLIELKYEVFHLEETFKGSGDNGTGGGPSLSIGVTF